MKRCCRYTLELTIFELVPGDRLFKLLQLCFLLQHICLDSLSPLSGSEFLQISDRLPELKSLVVKNCRLHFKFARDFQRMLDGLQHLQVLSVTKCESFDKLEIERLPSSLRILQLNYLDGSFDRQLRLIQTIRQNVPNINVLILDESTELAHFQIQAFQNIKVLILPFDNWDWRSNRWENVEFYPPEFLQRLTALDLGNIAIEFGILRISAMQLPRLEYLVINLIRTSNVNQLFTQIVGLPSLRSFTFEMKGNNWENLNYKHRDKQLYNSLVSLAQKGLIEKLRSLFFKGRISKQRETWEEFDWRNFHKLLSDLKKGELPKENGEKLQMLKIVFGDWKGELFLSSWQLVTTTHPWIECFDKPTPSHVLEEVCLRELGENADVTTELFKFPPRVKVPEKIINNE
uniref:Disease resistance RPP13-like protein 1 n=1 Tax=Meloidogyne hapla TaxID=6305 RepID=A0A1I8BWE2_MELHA